VTVPILATPTENAERRLADIRAELASARSRLGPDLDFDANFALREEIGLLERKEAAAVDALAHAEQQRAKQAEETQKAKEVAEVEAYRREAEREIPSRLRKLAKHLESAAPEIATVDAHVRRVGQVNALAHKHGLPPVIDGETLFRATPRRFIPAIYEERVVWVDGAGNKPSVFGRDGNGQLVPTAGGYMKTQERVQVSPERVEGGSLPGGRLADAVKLVDLNGRTIWPVAS
jgi:hypothetical protein